MSNKNPEEAIRLLKLALALDPDNRILIDAEQVLPRRPAHRVARRGAGGSRLMAAVGCAQVAENKLQAAKLKLHGLQQLKAAEFTAAAATFDAAAQLDPDDAELPQLRRVAEDKAKAMKLAVLAKSKFDHDPSAFVGSSGSSVRVEVFALFDEALCLDPDNAMEHCCHAEIKAMRDACQVRKTPEVGLTSALYGCIPTGIHGPTCIC